jgi:1-acyl-sn-glycerol-3-phosphate acyltransferase
VGLVAALYLTLVFWYLTCLPFMWNRAAVRRIVHSGARLMVPFYLWVAGVRVRWEGRANFEAVAGGPFIVLSNHASTLDPMCQMVALDRVDIAYVAKAHTLRRFLIGRLLKASDWFAVERESPVSLKRFQEDLQARIKAGWVPRLGIFPEGTRTPDGKLQKFHIGPFLVAAQLRLPLLPVLIRGTFPIHKGGAFTVYPGPVRVQVMPALRPDGARTPKEQLEEALLLQRRAEEIFKSVPDYTVVEDAKAPVSTQSSQAPQQAGAQLS